MTVPGIVLATLAVLPSDRMAMADRMFDRGEWAAARSEYAALEGAQGIAPDELLYRLAECARLAGDAPGARAAYAKLLDRYPLSRHAARSRLMKALSGASDGVKIAELKLLDTDKTDAKTRAAALYHLGSLAKDADALDRCARLDPSGPYALYAKFKHASIIAESGDPVVRRSAIRELIDIHYGPDKELAREAVYFAATRSYSDGRYGEASTLFRRYLKMYPGDKREKDVRNMAAWSDYLAGRYRDAAALCGEGSTDDAAYLLAACAYASGDNASARDLMLKYLEKHPQGKYRKSVELPLARMAFDAAEASGDGAGVLEAAKRAAALSGAAQDKVRLAWALEKAGRDAEALAAYEAVASEFPGTGDAAEALFRKAMMDVRAGRWSPAELALAESIAAGGNPRRKAEALYWRGIAATRLGHDAEGAGFLEEALAAGIPIDESREARMILADGAFKSGRLAAAKAEYAKLVREGAADRMGASKIHSVGRFLLECAEGESALDAVRICAKALEERGKSPEWRQAAFALLGECEEAAGEFSAAIGSYRRAMAEAVRTDESRVASLNLGILLSKAGEYAEAESALKESVSLNASDPARRATAYLQLAKNCEASGDVRGACAYATVLASLFEGSAQADEAKKILEAHPGEAK